MISNKLQLRCIFMTDAPRKCCRVKSFEKKTLFHQFIFNYINVEHEEFDYVEKIINIICERLLRRFSDFGN